MILLTITALEVILWKHYFLQKKMGDYVLRAGLESEGIMGSFSNEPGVTVISQYKRMKSN